MPVSTSEFGQKIPSNAVSPNLEQFGDLVKIEVLYLEIFQRYELAHKVL
jgi:hypothetical protein